MADLIHSIVIKQELLLEQQVELLQLLKQVLLSASTESLEKDEQLSEIIGAPMETTEQLNEFCKKLDNDKFRRQLVRFVVIVLVM